MLYRIPSLVIVAVALVALAGGLSMAAGDQVHEAKVVKAGDGKITLTFKGDNQKHTHDVAKNAKITLDDKKAKLEDLKEGFAVRATMDAKFVITAIEANKVTDAMVVKAGEGKITLTFKGDDKKHTHDVAKDAKITVDDKKGKLEDLKEGFHVSVTMNAEFVLTKIDAMSKAK